MYRSKDTEETNAALIEFIKQVDTFFDAYCNVIESALLCGNLRKNRKTKKNKYAVGILYTIGMRIKTPAIEFSRWQGSCYSPNAVPSLSAAVFICCKSALT